MNQLIKANVQKKLEQTLKSLEEDMSGISASQASTKMLDRVLVESHGDRVRLTQVAHASAIDKQTLKIQPWDVANLKNIEKGINAANLGVNVSNEAGILIVKLPIVTEERRKEMTKVISQFGEKAKVAIRHIRRDGMETLKKLEKEGVSEDIVKKETAEIDKLVEEYNKKVNKRVEEKNLSLMSLK